MPPVAALELVAEPVAVVGMGCRFPGGVGSPEELWDFLCASGDGVIEVPGDRWDAEALFDANPDTPGRAYSRHGGFITGIDEFDDRFFGIPPREAIAMDPQQRLLLEVTWETLEHAGIAPDGLRDTETGVFLGLGASDYLLRGARSIGLEGINAYVGTGNAASVASGRLSYVLGLRGPSMVIDTACSSSLVAVHLACQSLRNNECELALAGGVNLMLAPDTTVVLSKARMLSPSGRCRTFDAAADGYVRGEGCGVIALRRLKDAQKAGNTVLGIIRGSAINQDGHSNGLTAPRGPAQERVIERALDVAGVAGRDVGYVEAHGTGTALGDPIEVGALARVYGGTRECSLLVGSVKTNIGHLEAAAGIAGLIKAVLVVAHGVVPPHLHLRELNPRVPWEELALRVPRELSALPEGPRLAGVSSFGFSGTNAHLILEGPPERTAAQSDGVTRGRGVAIVKVAARGEAALKAAAGRLAEWVHEHPEAGLSEAAWAADVGRAELPHRAAVIAGSREELAEGLRSLVTGSPGRGLVRGAAPAGTPPKSAFLIAGQGARAAGAAGELYHAEPVFRHALDRLAEVLGALEELPLAILFDAGEEGQAALASTEHAQPALYALAVALGEWWRAAGVTVDAFAGHSVGAYAAAALAGVFSLEDGARLIATRGQLMGTLPAGTAMAAVFAAEREVRTALAGAGTLAEDATCTGDPAHTPHDAVELTAVNTPGEVVLAGEEHALELALERLAAQDIGSRRLGVAHAFHTRHVEPILARFQEELAATVLSPPTRPLVSDTSGELLGAQAADPAYWVHHARHPTRFARVLATLHELGCRQLIELGPATTLLNMAHATLDPETHTLLASLRPGHPPTRQLLHSAAAAWANGTPLDWAHLNQPRPPSIPHLPTYPFQRRRHWLPENSGQATPPAGSAVGAAHDRAPTANLSPAMAMPPASAQRAANDTRAADDTRAAQGEPSELAERLRRAPPAERPALMLAHVSLEVATVLAIDTADLYATEEGLFDLGLDSLMALELKSRFERTLGCALPNTLVIDHPTIEALAEYLLADVLSVESTGAGRRRRARHSSTDEPIAIVGMACRFPGGANDLDAYWRLLSDGVDGVGQVPPSRWDADAFYDPDPDVPFRMYTKSGGFLDIPVDEFDAEMFGISPREASSMDPQQRLLLEVGWEALEDAGVTGERAAGSRTGVFLGINTADYSQLLAAGGIRDIDAYLATGNAFSVAAGRLSYLLGLQGPSMAIDTACSSSLVAAHLASQSLRSGETDRALVAGVNLMLSPATTIGMAKLRALSPDGRCKTFDAAADGYGRGEGCGVLVLRRLADAVAEEDRVWATLRGSAVNQDGRSAGLTVPNGPAQYALISEALAAAGVEPALVSYVEAHGTGTPLGDPTELQALASALRPGRDAAQPVVVGSAKTNIGHLEAAAGVAGLIKVALALAHEEIPPHLHFHTPSPHIPWDDLPVVIPTERVAWPTGSAPRIAGVSSFGFSGTNAHIVLEEAPAALPTEEAPRGQEREQTELLLLSARSPEALRDLARSYHAILADPDAVGAPTLADVCAAAAVRRSHHRHRLALVARPTEAADALAHFLRGEPVEHLRLGRASPAAQSLSADGRDTATLASMVHGAEERTTMLDALGALYTLGYPLAHHERHPPGGRWVQLPTYPWKRTRHWLPGARALTADGRRLDQIPSADGLGPDDIQRQRLDDLLYAVAWQPSNRTMERLEPHPDGPGTWILLAEHDGAGAELASHLEALGERCRVVAPGPSYTASGEHWTIDPANPDDAVRLLAEVCHDGAPPLRGMVHLWGSGPTTSGAIQLEDLVSASTVGCGALLHLVHALAGRKDGEPPRLWVITRGAQPVTSNGSHISPLHAPLWGLARVVALEHPELWGGLIDLDPAGATEEPDLLLHELWSPDAEDQIAYRSGERRVPRLTRRPLAARTAGELTLRPDASYLVTGGRGSLGLKVARWLAARGARHIILCGRHPLPERSTWESLPEDSGALAPIAAIHALEALGVTVHTPRADVADRVEMAALLDSSRTPWPAVRGVVHAAGVFQLQAIGETRPADLHAVLRPKVQGTWILHELTRDADLDFFVMFSSAASVWGSALAGHYTAANHFEDVLAHYRGRLGLPALAVNWGWWSGSDMVRAQAQSYFDSIGLGVVPEDLAFTALEQLLLAGEVQRTVAPVDWSKFRPIFEARRHRPLLDLMETAEDPESPVACAEGQRLIERLQVASVTSRRTIMADFLEHEVAEVMGMDATRRIDPKLGFFEAGMDSIMSVQLTNRLTSQLGITLRATAAFEHPNVEDLARHILEDVLHLDEPGGSGVGPPTAGTRGAARTATRESVAEPVAVVGMGCRFPGGVGSPEELWDFLCASGDGVIEVPGDRWDAEALFDANPDTPGRAYSRHGGFITGIDEFDDRFFGIPPREAIAMDPQQRLLLEVTWETLEHAGIAPDGLRDTETGVFLGLGASDYLLRGARSIGLEGINAYVGTGNAASVASGRLSYVLGLRGPSMVIDTACSSSLVAVHLACQSLRNNECELALAGGVNLMLAPDTTVVLSKARMLSPSGRCRTFDAAADGYVRGEGCGVIALRRLKDAQKAGNTVLGIIRGSAINQDGHSSGLTVPYAAAQERVIERALGMAGVAGRDVGYVEAHGTGTALGDPIEVGALARVYGSGREQPRGAREQPRDEQQKDEQPREEQQRGEQPRGARECPLLVGSVKTNIGHLEAAAGIAGLIKAVLVVGHGVVPPHLHLRELNPRAPWEELALRVPRELSALPEGRRLAGVSSFGFSGTNAHLVLEGPPERTAAQSDGVTRGRGVAIVKVAARGQAALTAAVGRLARWVQEHPEVGLDEVAWAADVGRAELPDRVAVIAGSREELVEGLRSVTEGSLERGVVRGVAPVGTLPKSASPVADQGSQTTDAAAALYRAESPHPGAHPDLRRLLHGAAAAWADGAPLDWERLNQSRPPTVPHLPTYPFQRRRHWLPEDDPHAKPIPEDNHHMKLPEDDRHAKPALTPRPVHTPLPQRIVEIDLSTIHHSYLAEHRVHDHTVVPGVTYLELLLTGAEASTDAPGPQVVRELTLHQPLILTSERSHTLQAIIDPPDGGAPRSGRLYSRSPESEEAWTLHATATLAAGEESPAEAIALGEIRSRLGQEISGEDFYRRVWHPDFELGESFRLVERVWIGDGEALGLVRMAAPSSAAVRGGIRPELLTLDACAQLLMAARHERDAGAGPERPVALGAGFERFDAYESIAGPSVWCWATMLDGDPSAGDLVVADAEGTRLAKVHGVAFRRVARETLRRLAGGSPRDRGAPAAATAGLAVAPSRKTLLAASPPERRAILASYLQARLGLVVGLAPEELHPMRPITDLADSLMLAELKTDVEADLAVEVPLETLFEDPTIAGFASWLADRLLDCANGATPGAQPEHETIQTPAATRPSGADNGDAWIARERHPTPTRSQSLMSVTELSGAAALDPAIAPRTQPDLARAAHPRAVLLTGASEYVGAFVLAALLARTDAQVHCLLQADDHARAREQIDAALRRYGLDRDVGARVVPILGELGRPRLGLGQRAFAALADRVEGIYHVGTAAQWTYPFRALAPVNVEGTREILRLATTGVPVPVHLFSTVGVFSSPEYHSAVVLETEPLEHSGGLSVGYAQTRWVAERMVRTAAARGLPVTIHRPAVGADSRTGAYDRNHHMCLMLKGCVELGCAPDWDVPIQLAPVDYIAAAIVELSLRPERYGETFHLVNPSVLRWTELAERLRAFGYQLERLPFERWRELLLERGRTGERNTFSSLLPFLAESIEQARLPRFDCAGTLAALTDTSIICPPLDDDFLRMFLSRLIATGYIFPPPVRNPGLAVDDELTVGPP